jgi:hypothetical protein
MDLQQLDNWVINARVRMWRPLVCTVFKQYCDDWMAVALVSPLHSGVRVCVCVCVYMPVCMCVCASVQTCVCVCWCAPALH